MRVRHNVRSRSNPAGSQPSVGEEDASIRSGQAQPRPALGRRPWFALLRRARNFLRFAFAMGERLPDRGDLPHILQADGDGGAIGPVVVCAGPVARLRGLRPLSGGVGALFVGSRAHGHGVVETLVVVGVDAGGVTIATARLDPGGSVAISGARFLLEIPHGCRIPTSGEPLRLRSMLAPCPDV